MYESAYLKIDRAKCHIDDLNALLQKQRPFTYVLDYNAKTGECITRAKKNEAVIAKCALICGDIVHNLRSALDHAMWEIVSPFCTTNAERKKVQFPFCSDPSRLKGTIENGLIDRAAPEVGQKIERLKPYSGGYKLLYFLHETDVLDKHKLLIPTGDYTRIDSNMIRQEISDIPLSPLNGPMSFGQNMFGDMLWNRTRLTDQEIRQRGLPADGKVEQILNVPVEIVFELRSANKIYPVVATLHTLVNVTKDVVNYLVPNIGVDPPPVERT